MRQFLAVAILGAALAVTASSAFADDRGSDRVIQDSTTLTQPNATQTAASSDAMAGEFKHPQKVVVDHERL